MDASKIRQFADDGGGELGPIAKDSLSDQAYWQIRRALKRAHFRPRQKLILRTVAAELGVSLTPLREAFARLISENALAVDARGIVYVPEIGAEHYREIRDIRILLEGRAAFAAAERVTPADLEILRDYDRKFRNAKHAAAALEANEQFHFHLYAMSGMPVLHSIIEGLWIRCGPLFIRLREHSLSTHTNARHQIILDGLEARDPAFVRYGVTEDIMAGWEALFGKTATAGRADGRRRRAASATARRATR